MIINFCEDFYTIISLPFKDDAPWADLKMGGLVPAPFIITSNAFCLDLVTTGWGKHAIWGIVLQMGNNPSNE